jgi:hypothetical protein
VNVGRRPQTEFECLAFAVERESNFHAQPKSTSPATAAVSSAESQPASPSEKPDLNSVAECETSNPPGVRRFNAGMMQCLRLLPDS